MAQRELIWIISGGLVGAALLARFGLAFRYLSDVAHPSLAGFLRYSGVTLLGGLAGAYIGVVLTRKMIGFRRPTGDVLAPGVALGIAIGRIGCHLAEQPGTATTLRWGVHVAPELSERFPGCEACRAGLAMHPSFIYESLFLAAAAWILFSLARRPPSQPALPWLAPGDLFKLFLLAYATFRFFVEFVRGNPMMAAGLTGSQLMVLPAAVVLAGYFLRRRMRARMMVFPAGA
jgi:prolipoprotein diacylglyceryltransferase